MPHVDLEAARKPVGEREIGALKKAKRQEERRIKKGWRYYKISNNTSVLVPFDKRKNAPTEEGKRLIEKQKEILGIKFMFCK